MRWMVAIYPFYQQAGYDALMTLLIYFKLQESFTAWAAGKIEPSDPREALFLHTGKTPPHGRNSHKALQEHTHPKHCHTFLYCSHEFEVKDSKQQETFQKSVV